MTISLVLLTVVIVFLVLFGVITTLAACILSSHISLYESADAG